MKPPKQSLQMSQTSVIFLAKIDGGKIVAFKRKLAIHFYTLFKVNICFRKSSYHVFTEYLEQTTVEILQEWDEQGQTQQN